MENKQRNMIREIEKNINRILTEEEKMICLISYSIGVTDGLDKAEELIRKIK